MFDQEKIQAIIFGDVPKFATSKMNRLSYIAISRKSVLVSAAERSSRVLCSLGLLCRNAKLVPSDRV